jgi:hypothetical protein
MKKLFLSILVSMPLSIFGMDIGETAWIVDNGDGYKSVILLESDKTFTYLSGYMGGKVWGDEIDTWSINGNKLVLSFTDGYRIMSFTFNDNGTGISGTSINQAGTVTQVSGELILKSGRY